VPSHRSPFVILDPAAVWRGVYRSYITAVKDYVWTQTTWALDTYGLTAVLLRSGAERYVEIVQAATLLAFYTLARPALRRGVPSKPLMATALLLFSMTTIWPVLYVYFDV
jgi:hypothetical protein